MEAALAQMRDRIVAAHRAKSPLRLRGAGTKDFYGESVAGEPLDTRCHSGIIDYEPTELVITVRCGTPLSVIEATLAERGQFLPFEPPAFGADPTIGGVIAAGLSGPRRAFAGAARDFVLGASLLDANGELLHFGGQVMKNVAGFDVSRLLCGSLGILGLITQVSLKVLPKPRAEATLRFEQDAGKAFDSFNRLRSRPLPISATCWHDGIVHIRLSGSPSALRAARESLGGAMLDNDAAQTWWQALRNQTHAFFSDAAAPGQRLWRLSVPPAAPLDVSAVDLFEWSGALRWMVSDLPADTVRARVEKIGGSATLWRGHDDATMFHPLAPATLALHQRLKRQFDPHGIFNRGRLVRGL
ncbi:MAG TPA: glycolate oxidase subunit GlcE [Rudaea sp.]|jgi:glycolate oxidase FAD binding subunit